MFIRIDCIKKRQLFPVLICLSLLTGCSGLQSKSPEPVKEIMPGIIAGYLNPEELPDSLALLPAPPAQGSEGFALDEAVSQKSRTLQGTPRWDLAIQDAQLAFPEAADTFTCALGISITEQDTPYLYMLLRRTLADAGLSTYTAKKKYQRKRPFMLNEKPICTPEDEEKLRKDGSYPSGHTAIGWAWALILCEIAPEKTDALLARGWAFGESRNVCNVHWHSDVAQGRIMGAAAVARLHADEQFLKDLEMAKKEYANALEKGLVPTRDCQAETDALAGGTLLN